MEMKNYKKISVNFEIKYSKQTNRSKGTKKEANYIRYFVNGYLDSIRRFFPVTLVSYLNYYKVETIELHLMKILNLSLIII